jgi:hypothetical protein
VTLVAAELASSGEKIVGAMGERGGGENVTLVAAELASSGEKTVSGEGDVSSGVSGNAGVH